MGDRRGAVRKLPGRDFEAASKARNAPAAAGAAVRSLEASVSAATANIERTSAGVGVFPSSFYPFCLFSFQLTTSVHFGPLPFPLSPSYHTPQSMLRSDAPSLLRPSVGISNRTLAKQHAVYFGCVPLKGGGVSFCGQNSKRDQAHRTQLLLPARS